MSTSTKLYFGYPYGVSHSTRNISSVAWAILSPNGELVNLQGICINHSTNNIVEYIAVVELLPDSISHGIHHLVIKPDSQLMVIQLTNVYSVRSLTILHIFLSVFLLERHFGFIQYEHISKNINTLTNALANYVLDRHLQ